MLRVLVIILVFVSALFVFVSNQPEKVFARSDDGVVEVEGVSRDVNSVLIDSVQTLDPVLSQHFGSYYKLTLDTQGASFDATVRVKALEQWKQIQPDITELSIYYLNQSTNKWEAIPTVVDLSDETLEVRIELQEPIWIAVGVL